MPVEIRMNLFLIDCAELNQKLINICYDLIDMILIKTSEYIFTDTAQSISAGFKTLSEQF